MRSPICAAALAAVATLTLAGCVGTTMEGQQVSGAVELHQHAPREFKRFWAEYARTPKPQHFAMARDGSSMGYSSCPAPTTCPNYNSSRYQALQYCRANATAGCDIYATGIEIVWPHAFPWVVGAEQLYDHRERIGATDRWQGPGDAPAIRLEDGREVRSSKRWTAMCRALPDNRLEIGPIGYDEDTDLKHTLWEECARLGLKSRQ